jgi:predicted DsbA family dithiol-disulfide isomerase
MPQASPVTIDVVSDVVCPWCFIGKRRLEKALALKPDIPVEVRYHPYFLNPWVPAEGMSRDEYLTTKFGSPDRYKQIAGRVAAAAAEEGLTYAVDKMKRQPNTRDSHRLILWAQASGKAPQMKQRLMDLYFTEGADLSDREVLVKAAADVGLDADEVRRKLASDEDVAQVEQAANAAKNAGIDGVPTFIIGGVAAISGAQDPQVLGNAIEQIANNREQFLAQARAAAG